MSLTIWTNHVFRPEARTSLENALHAAGHRLLVSASASPVVLAAGGADETLGQADVAYGQPDVAQVMACPRLKYVALSTAGYTRYDRADFRAAMTARGAVVTNSSQVFADPCAQHVLAQMLALERRLPSQLRNQDGVREWRYLDERFASGVLTRRRVVLLGFGAIGRRLAELLKPFGSNVVAFRRKAEGNESVPVVGEAELAGALGRADHVVNILPETDLTRHWMSAQRFAQLKPQACFYNIGRGTTVDQDALIEALKSQRLAAAYLDVMSPEPLPPTHPLWTTSNCFLTCHIGGGTREQDEVLVAHFVANLEAYSRGRPLVDRIV